MALPAASLVSERNEVEVAPAWSRPSGVLPLVIPICTGRHGAGVVGRRRRLRVSAPAAHPAPTDFPPEEDFFGAQSLALARGHRGGRRPSAWAHLGGTKVDVQLLQVHDVLEHCCGVEVPYIRRLG